MSCRDCGPAAVGLGVWPLVEKSIQAATTIVLAGGAGWESDEFNLLTMVNETTVKAIPSRGCRAVCGGGMILDIWADERNGVGGAFVGILESIDVAGGLFTEGRLIQPGATTGLRWSTRVTGPVLKFVVSNTNAATAVDVQLGIYLRNR